MIMKKKILAIIMTGLMVIGNVGNAMASEDSTRAAGRNSITYADSWSRTVTGRTVGMTFSQGVTYSYSSYSLSYLSGNFSVNATLGGCSCSIGSGYTRTVSLNKFERVNEVTLTSSSGTFVTKAYVTTAVNNASGYVTSNSYVSYTDLLK